MDRDFDDERDDIPGQANQESTHVRRKLRETRESKESRVQAVRARTSIEQGRPFGTPKFQAFLRLSAQPIRWPM